MLTDKGKKEDEAMQEELHPEEEQAGAYDEEDLDTVILTLDDDAEIECAILDIFPVADKEYIALVPLQGDERILLYEYIEQEEEEEAELAVIESDEEFDQVVEEFDRILQQEEEKEKQEEQL